MQLPQGAHIQLGLIPFSHANIWQSPKGIALGNKIGRIKQLPARKPSTKDARATRPRPFVSVNSLSQGRMPVASKDVLCITPPVTDTVCAREPHNGKLLWFKYSCIQNGGECLAGPGARCGPIHCHFPSSRPCAVRVSFGWP